MPFWRDSSREASPGKSFSGSWGPASSGTPVVKPKAKPPPAALRQQIYNASSRWDDASSTSSWTRLEEDVTAEGLSSLPTVQETDPSVMTEAPGLVPPPPPQGGPPVQQAAQCSRQLRGCSTTPMRTQQVVAYANNKRELLDVDAEGCAGGSSPQEIWLTIL